jgi:uncharacterized protein
VPMNSVTKSLFILYVEDQARSAAFYSRVLDSPPSLDEPGFTEFQLSENTVLGLMSVTGVKHLLGPRLPDPTQAAGVPRGELYLVVRDPLVYHQRALEAGAMELSGFEQRDWGDWAAYSLDPDGHVLTFAKQEEPASA